MLNKRGQFFLLAAVIISSVLVSMGIVANEAIIGEEPADFFKYNFQIKKESSEVIAYQLNNPPSTEKISEFVDQVSFDLRDKDPDTNFMFIYGNTTNLTIANYGSERAHAVCMTSLLQDCGETVLAGESLIEGRIISSGTIQKTISSGGISGTPIIGWNSGRKFSYSFSGGVDQINLTIRDTTFTFEITPDPQLIFIMQKDIQDESFIAVN